MDTKNNNSINQYLSLKDVKTILSNYGYSNSENVILNYCLNNANNKMLGFMGDYWRLKVTVSTGHDQILLSFFIKAISRSNAAKADMVREWNVFEKELIFYTDIISCLHVPDMKPWCPRLVAHIDEALVLQDLNAMDYKVRNKYLRFDMAHTLQALNMLARFHASSFIFEEKRSIELKRPYRLDEEYQDLRNAGGYKIENAWYRQCMIAAIESLKLFSKYKDMKHDLCRIATQWEEVWSSVLNINDSTRFRNVVCHRDLWNNNLLFHYDAGEPDDCVMVDFQATKYQTPASDVMLLLYCNLDPKFREQNINLFLHYYYDELQSLLNNNGVNIRDILSESDFLESAEEQRQWGAVVCGALIQLFWVDDDKTTDVFSDSGAFHEILNTNKTSFVNKMINDDPNYRAHVLEILEEIAERYCLNK